MSKFNNMKKLFDDDTLLTIMLNNELSNGGLTDTTVDNVSHTLEVNKEGKTTRNIVLEYRIRSVLTEKEYGDLIEKSCKALANSLFE